MATEKAKMSLTGAQQSVGLFLSLIAAGTFFWNIAAWKNTKDINDDQLAKTDVKQSEQIDKLVSSVDTLKGTVTELVTEMKVDREHRSRAEYFDAPALPGVPGSKQAFNNRGQSILTDRGE